MLAPVTRSTENAVVVEVHAQPGAKRATVTLDAVGALRVAVTAPADTGRANAAVIEALAGALGVRRTSIVIVSGHTSRRKRIRVEGVSPERLASFLAELAASVPR